MAEKTDDLRVLENWRGYPSMVVKANGTTFGHVGPHEHEWSNVRWLCLRCGKTRFEIEFYKDLFKGRPNG